MDLARAPTPEALELSAESSLLGEYELLGELGRGGMGIVYKARHRGLQRVVALKVTRFDSLTSVEEAKRFQQEAAAVARLDHPNIVPVYEIGEAGGRPFYSMALVEGTSLARAAALSPLPPRAAAELMRAVAEAIAYAHEQGIVHRDLKPENILLDASGRPRVTDFGLAKCAETDSRLTQAGEALGTPSYMPPEQAQGRMDQVGPLSDVYSLGATLYCVLTGRPPFRAATSLDTLKHVVERDPVPPRQFDLAIDRDLETICLKCLEKAPDRRYPSAAALADDLGRYLQGRGIQARPVRTPEKAVRWCRRNPLVAAALGSLAAVFLAAFAVVSWSHLRLNAALAEEARQRGAADHARDEARRHEQAERWERYRANMATVSSALPSQNVAAARRAIGAAPADHRNWEWRHFRQLLDQSRQILPRHDRPVDRVYFGANGHLLTANDRLRFWELSSGREARPPADLNLNAWPQIGVCPSGRRVAYQRPDNAIVVYDLAAGRELAAVHGAGAGISALGFDGLGRVVACTEQNRAIVWSPTGERVGSWAFGEGSPSRLGCDVAGRLLLVSTYADNSARLWGLEGGRKAAVLPGHRERVITAAISRDGARAVTAEAFPSNVIRLWDTRTGHLEAELRGHCNLVNCAHFSPDGARLATTSFDQTVCLWEGRTGARVATLKGHTGRVLAAAFSPDSKRLVSASQDQTLRLWNATTGELVAVLCGHEGDVHSVEFNHDGSLIASGSVDGTARIWDARLSERNGILRGHTSFVYSVAFHPDGRRVASAGWDGTVRLWDATTGRQTSLIRYPRPTYVCSVAIDRSGKLLATLDRDDAVHLWDADTGRHLHRWGVPTAHWRDTRIAFSAGGDLLAAGSHDGTVRIWDVTSRAERAALKGHRSPVLDVAFSPDGRWLASAGAEGDDGVRIWDLEGGGPVRLLRGHREAVLSLAFSKDGALLASGSKDGTVRLWDAGTWEEVGVLKHGTNVYGLAFTPDGTRLATGCADNTVRFWDVPTRQVVAELHGHGSYVHSLAFSPDGTRLASASGDFTVRIWDTLSARQRSRAERRGE